MSTDAPATPAYTKKDFMSDQTIRWCPGCGDYSILSQVQTVFPTLGVARENFAIISGIGCSSRFPYYMNTYGFHTIHGRAPAFATGLKLTRPELSVWVITGDGDATSIGGNHFIHLLRRNVDLNILMFNNQIYGLTKGQYSPTSEVGKRTKSSPMGSVDHPFNPAQLALGAGAAFVARSADVLPAHLREQVTACYHHKGTSFLEILQNCNIFNDGAFDGYVAKDVRDDALLYVEHGKPLIFGKNQDKGLVVRGTQVEIVALGDGVTAADVLVHDETDYVLAQLIAGLRAPLALGVIYRIERPTYDEGFAKQVVDARAKLGWGDLEKLVHGSDVWEVRG